MSGETEKPHLTEDEFEAIVAEYGEAHAMAIRCIAEEQPMAKPYTTRDEFESIDAEFDTINETLIRYLDKAQPITAEIEAAADRMFDIAIQQAEPGMMACCMARFGDFIKQSRTPPWAMLEHVADAFTRFRFDAPSLDEAFGIKRKRGETTSYWKQREIARTRSRVIEHFTHEGLSENKAIAKAEEIFEEPDLKRAYQKYRRKVKGK